MYIISGWLNVLRVAFKIKQKGNLTETPLATKEKQITVGIQVDEPVKKNDKIYKLKRVE